MKPENLRKQVSYMLAPSTLSLIEEQRKRLGLNNAQIIAEGVRKLAEKPFLITETPHQPYGSGKKPKVFNLTLETFESIERLAVEHDEPRTHVVDVAIRLLDEAPISARHPNRGTSSHLLAMSSDEDLLGEISRRGLLKNGNPK